MKAAVLEGDQYCGKFVMVSIYNTKPFYNFSTCAKEIKWKPVRCKIWNQEKNQNVQYSYLKLNLINDYNCDMDHVDIADHLRGSYRLTY